MSPEALRLSGELAAMLAQPQVIDPRTVDVRHSNLKEIEKSPAHYFYAVQDDSEETLAMRLGSGAHAMLLGKPWKLWDKPAKKGSGKAPRNGEQWDEFVKENEGCIILNAAEKAKAEAMADSVRRNKVAMRLLEDTVKEQTVRWDHLGRICRSTPDARSRLHVGEFKTAQSSEPTKFKKDAYWRRYHSQLAFYLDALKAAGEGSPDEAYIIAVESTPPHPVSVLRLSDRAIEHGRQLWRDWFDRLLECEAKNDWLSVDVRRRPR